MTIRFDNECDGEMIAEAAGTFFNPECDKVIARVVGKKLLGGVIYQAFTGESIEMHVASFRSRWINKELLWVCLHYPFVQLDVSRIFIRVREANTVAGKFCYNLGFELVTKIDGVYPDGGDLIMRMERDECRWLKLEPKFLESVEEV
jgi:RimJ/RimL family protein N-acetyltransferase